MDISNQFQEIRIFLTQNRFVMVLPPAPLPARRAYRPEGRAYASERKSRRSALGGMSMPAMPKIVGHFVTGQKPAHYGGN